MYPCLCDKNNVDYNNRVKRDYDGQSYYNPLIILV